MSRTTKELIERQKEYIWFLYDESDRIHYLINTCSRTTHLKIEQEALRQYIANAHYDLNKFQWRYQDEQRQAEAKRRQQAEVKRRQQVEAMKCQQAKVKEFQKAAHKIVSICSSMPDETSCIKDDISLTKNGFTDLLAHIRAEKEEKKEQEQEDEKEQEEEEEQEKENEDVHNSEVVDSCDVSIEILKVPKVEPEIVCEQQIDKNSEVFELFVTEEKTVQEVYLVKVDNVEFNCL